MLATQKSKNNYYVAERINSDVNASGSLEYGLAFSTGLTIVSASGTSANATVIYE